MGLCTCHARFSYFHTVLENSRAWLAHLLALRALSGLLPRVMARFQAPATDPSGLARVCGPGRAALASRCVWNEGRAAPTRTKCAAFPVPHALWRVQPRAYRSDTLLRLCSHDNKVSGGVATLGCAACAVLSLAREWGSWRP